MVVVDSMNGFLNAMPHGAVCGHAGLHELLAYLSQQGVATILTSAHGAALSAPCNRPST